MKVRFEVCSFERIEPTEWRSLFQRDRSKNLFYSYEFLRAALTVLGDPPVEVILGREEGKLVFGLPFMNMDRRIGKEFRVFSVYGADHVQPLTDGKKTDSLLEAFWRFFFGQLSFDLFSGMGMSGDFVKFMRKCVPVKKVLAEESFVCPYIELPATTEDFLGSYRSNFRRQLKKKVKRAASDNLQFRIVSGRQMPSD